MGDLTAPAAVSALSLAFGDTPGERSSFARFGERAPGLARRTAAEAMSRALGGRDRAPVASRPAGSRVRSRRARTLATMTGDVRFERAVPLDRAGDTACPLGDDLGLPMGGRASPSARGFLVTCGADVPFERTAGLMELGGGPRVLATAAMRSIRRAGEAVVATERKAARDLFSDGAAPEADREADRVLVEADGTHATTRGRSAKAEAKAMVAHAGKEGVTGGRVSREIGRASCRERV